MPPASPLLPFALRGGDDEVRILRIDDHLVDLGASSSRPMCVHVLPASVDLYMPSPSPRHGVAGADIDDVGIRRRDLDRADAVDVRELIEDRNPRHSGARRLPHAADRRADIERARLADHAGDGRDAAAVEGADVAPGEAGIEFSAERRRRLPLPHRAKASRSGCGVDSQRDGAGQHESQQGK